MKISILPSFQPSLAAFSLLALWAAHAPAATNAIPVTASESIPFSTPEKTVLSDVEEEAGLGAVSFSFGGVARADVADTPASYALSGFEIGAGIGPVGASFKRLSFDWQHTGDFVLDTHGKKPWGDLNEASALLNWGGSITTQSSYFVMGGVSVGYEDQTDDAYSLFGGAIFSYQFTSNWSASAGALLSHHPKVATSLQFVPVAGIDWRASATHGLTFSLGVPTTEIAWIFHPGTRLVLDMSSFEGGLYRLADDNPLRPSGYVELVNSSVSLRFETLLWKHLGLSLGVGQALDREFNLYDSEGDNKKSYDIENRPGFLATVSMAF